jgi:hypothetical protein
MRVFVFLTVCAFIWLLLLFTAVKNAFPHDAPSGWTYDGKCCSGYDCRPVDGPGPRHHTIQVYENNMGDYVVDFDSGRSETILRNDARVNRSRDGNYHICTTQGKDDGRILCLYVPTPGV